MQIQHRDMVLENPAQDVEWRTSCRYCGAERGSGLASAFALAGVLAVAGVLLWLLVSPVLGGLLIVSAVMGLGWAGMITALGRSGSFFRYRG